jgi:hypothetical protein
MNVIDKFLKQYSYRFSKGYPDLTDPTDKQLMLELLSEIGIDEAPGTSVFTKETPEGDTRTYYKILKDTGLNDDILDKIGTIFNNEYEKNPNYLSKFSKENFRGRNIEDIKTIFNLFPEYVDIKGTGLGRGEIATIIGVKDSRSGGTAEKDIHVGDNVYDVKELSAGEFRTASGGYITTSDFKKHLDYLLSLLESLIGKDKKGTTGDNSIDNKINILLNYYKEGGYKTGGISEGAINSIEDLCKDLKDLDLSSETQPNYIKIGNKKFSLDKETYDKVQKGEPINNINLGDPISDKISLLTKIKKHPWISNPELVKENLNELWKEFLTTIQGLILIKKGIPEFYTSEQLANDFIPYRVVQNQINVKDKSTIKGSKKLKEDEEDFNI